MYLYMLTWSIPLPRSSNKKQPRPSAEGVELVLLLPTHWSACRSQREAASNTRGLTGGPIIHLNWEHMVIHSWKLMKSHESSWNLMKAHESSCKLVKSHEPVDFLRVAQGAPMVFEASTWFQGKGRRWCQGRAECPQRMRIYWVDILWIYIIHYGSDPIAIYHVQKIKE